MHLPAYKEGVNARKIQAGSASHFLDPCFYFMALMPEFGNPQQCDPMVR